MDHSKNKNTQKTVVSILGAPFSGATTQAGMLAERHDLYHVSTSKILRNLAKDKSERGKWVKGIIETGQYVPDYLMMEILLEALAEHKDAPGFVFDGYPRTIQQNLMLDDLFKRMKFNVSLYFVKLDVSQHELLRREKESLKRVKTPKEMHEREAEFEKTEHLLFSLKEKRQGGIVIVKIPDNTSKVETFELIQKSWIQAYLNLQ